MRAGDGARFLRHDRDRQFGMFADDRFSDPEQPRPDDGSG
jgi:hypothetical protein